VQQNFQNEKLYRKKVNTYTVISKSKLLKKLQQIHKNADELT